MSTSHALAILFILRRGRQGPRSKETSLVSDNIPYVRQINASESLIPSCKDKLKSIITEPGDLSQIGFLFTLDYLAGLRDVSQG